MTPLQHINFGDQLPEDQRNELFYNWRGKPIFVAFMQFLRDEAYSALKDAIDTGLKSDNNQSQMALGGFDRLSQTIVKIEELGKIPPKAPE